jgi:hypothetical protein
VALQGPCTPRSTPALVKYTCLGSDPPDWAELVGSHHSRGDRRGDLCQPANVVRWRKRACALEQDTQEEISCRRLLKLSLKLGVLLPLLSVVDLR